MISDKQFIQATSNWPNWPFLPMKKPTKLGFPDIKLIMEITSPMTTAADVKIVDLGALNIWQPDFKAVLREKLKTKSYTITTATELIAAGWVVD